MLTSKGYQERVNKKGLSKNVNKPGKQKSGNEKGFTNHPSKEPQQR